MNRYMAQAGLEFVSQRTTLIERRNPLRPVERTYIGNLLATHANLAIERNPGRHSEEDLALWRILQDPDAANHPLNSPDFYWCEGQAVAVARVP